MACTRTVNFQACHFIQVSSCSTNGQQQIITLRALQKGIKVTFRPKSGFCMCCIQDAFCKDLFQKCWKNILWKTRSPTSGSMFFWSQTLTAVIFSCLSSFHVRPISNVSFLSRTRVIGMMRLWLLMQGDWNCTGVRAGWSLAERVATPWVIKGNHYFWFILLLIFSSPFFCKRSISSVRAALS